MRSRCASELGTLIGRSTVAIAVFTVAFMLPSMIEATLTTKSSETVESGTTSRRSLRALQMDSSAAAPALPGGASRACAKIARRGLCAEFADVCPEECTVLGLASNVTDESVQWCAEIARRGQCNGLDDEGIFDDKNDRKMVIVNNIIRETSFLPNYLRFLVQHFCGSSNFVEK